MKLTGGRGVDLILDAVGKPTFKKGCRCLAPLGHLILFGRAGGVPDRLNPMDLFGKSIKVSGFAVTMIYALHEIHQRGRGRRVPAGARRQAHGSDRRHVSAAPSHPGPSLHGVAPLNRQADADSVG